MRATEIKVYSPQSKTFIGKGKDGKFVGEKSPQGAIINRMAKLQEPQILANNAKRR